MAYDEETIKKVWERGGVMPGYDPEVWRKDDCGAWMGRRFYGNKESQYGWEVIPVKPPSKGGGDDVSNLRPVQWENSESRKAGRYECVVTAADARNIRFFG